MSYSQPQPRDNEVHVPEKQDQKWASQMICYLDTWVGFHGIFWEESQAEGLSLNGNEDFGRKIYV